MYTILLIQNEPSTNCLLFGGLSIVFYMEVTQVLPSLKHIYISHFLGYKKYKRLWALCKLALSHCISIFYMFISY